MSNLDQLLQTQPAELVADLKRLRDERVVIERKEAVLQQILEMLVQEGGKTAEEIAALGGSAGIGSLRNQIVQALEAKQEESEFVVVPKEVHAALVALGNRTVTLDNVRVTMKRMVESNELEVPFPETHSLLYALPGAVDAFPGGRDALVRVIGGQAK
jgi:hypothetical protein